MKFGKEFQIHLEESLPEWRDKYLCYKPLKKLLKNVPTSGDSALFNPQQQAPSADLQDCFINTLNEELEKFNDFYVDKEEDFIIRFQLLSASKVGQCMEASHIYGIRARSAYLHSLTLCFFKRLFPRLKSVTSDHMKTTFTARSQDVRANRWSQRCLLSKNVGRSCRKNHRQLSLG